MSYKAYIQRAVFHNFGKEQKTFGYCIHDNFGQTYCDTMTQEDLSLPDPEFLKKASETFGITATSIFDAALDHGIYVDGCWYKFILNDDGWKLANNGANNGADDES